MSLLKLSSRHVWLQAFIAAVTDANSLQDGRSRELFGLRFPGPVGVAAGLDKNGVALAGLGALGFGFIEAGGVTQQPQAGNQRPRIWRFPKEEAVINWMNFPNRGAEAVGKFQSFTIKPKVPVGWGVSKSQITALEDTAEDMCYSMRQLHPYADYFIIDTSCPNTPGLRRLEEKELLSPLLETTVAYAKKLAVEAGLEKPRPLLVKVSPDLSEAALDGVVEVSLDRGMAGIVATNTTLQRELLTSPSVPDRGGLSGMPVAALSLKTVTYLSKALDGRLPIIGCGGINSIDSAQRMLDAGASLIQLYTGLIYQGPLLVKKLNRALRDEWLRNGAA